LRLLFRNARSKNGAASAAFAHNARNGSAIEVIVRGPNETTQPDTYAVSEAVAVLEEEEEEESEWPVTNTDVGLLNPQSAEAANCRVNSIGDSACTSRSDTPMLSVGGVGAAPRRLSFANEKSLGASGNRTPSRTRSVCASPVKFLANSGKVVGQNGSGIGPKMIIITQPRKSYYKSGRHVNPMICPLKSRAVMVEHKTITTCYEPGSWP
jgi:hypothetical protein